MAKHAILGIGNKVVFRSSKFSNLIGINHPCIVSVMNNKAILTIGHGVGFSGTIIGCFSNIRIGNNVRCGANTIITDSDWHNSDVRVKDPLPISIGDNVWIGMNSVILKGVTIGDNSIIGANSVVVKNIPANSIAAGNPCKVIKELE